MVVLAAWQYFSSNFQVSLYVLALRPTTRPRVLIADDDPISRQVIRARLQEGAGCEVIGEASDGLEALEQVKSKSPDVLLLDILMPQLAGLEALRTLSSLPKQPRTILLTSRISAKQMVEALQHGARGVMLKSEIDQLADAIGTVMHGEYWIEGERVSNVLRVISQLQDKAVAAAPPVKRFGLTDRELEVVGLVSDGCSNREIAKQLAISEETVKRHLTHIFDKVGMSNRLELALFAINQKLVPSAE